MKKYIWILLMLMIALVAFGIPASAGQNILPGEKQDIDVFFNNPVIEKEESVTLFAVNLPDSLKILEGNPFSGSEAVLLNGSVNSVGQDWAKKNGYRFALESRITAGKEAQQYVSLDSNKLVGIKNKESDSERTEQKDKDIRPGRTGEELKAASYDGTVSLDVRSRYFP